MKMGKQLLGVAAAAGMALGLGACSGGVDRDGTVDLLVDSGLDRPVAECIVDKSIDQIDVDVLVEDREPTPEEEELLFEIIGECATS